MGNFIVKKASPLLEYLFYLFPERSRKDVKNLLAKRMIQVNGKIQTKFDYPLQLGDQLVVLSKKTSDLLDIIYEDKELLVINKPSGLLSIATDRQREKTAYHLVREYLRQKDPKAMVFVVHRLDQFTSGVLMFAKNEKIKNKLQESWNDIVSKRGYLAIVAGNVKADNKTIRSYLKETKTQLVYSTKAKDGKLAITHYQVLKRKAGYSYLEVFLDTGRKNQIRVHLKEMGNPIVGDNKYGAKTNPIGRLGLHSHILELKHPITHQILHFEAKEPDVFHRLF